MCVNVLYLSTTKKKRKEKKENKYLCVLQKGKKGGAKRGAKGKKPKPKEHKTIRTVVIRRLVLLELSLIGENH